MKVLVAHRERTGTLKSAMDQMISLHDQLYSTWEQIVGLTRGDESDRVEQIEALHEQTRQLSSRIIALRRETFGGISDGATLNLASQVDSASLLFPQGEGESA